MHRAFDQTGTASMASRYVPGTISELIRVNFRFSGDTGPSDEGEKSDALEECIRHLYLLSSFPELQGKFIPVCDKTDQIWHYLIIQTRFYSDLCKNLPSGKFIHHGSLPFEDYLENLREEKKKHRVFVEFLSWIPLYVRCFGNFTPRSARHWKITDILTEQGMSLDDINRISSEENGH